MNSQGFLDKLLKFFKRALAGLLDPNNFSLEITDQEEVFFGIDPDTNPYKCKYNPIKLNKLMDNELKISEDMIKYTGKYFANHEYTHTTKVFLKFNKDWDRIDDDEQHYFSKNYQDKSFFSYKSIKYRLEDYFIDKAVDNEVINKEILFKVYNFKQILENINSLRESFSMYKDLIDDTSIFNTIKNILIKEGYINKILVKTICLYGLGCGDAIKKIIDKENMHFLNEIISNTITKIDEIKYEHLEVKEIKKYMIQLFNYLDELDIIELAFIEQ